MDLKHKLPRTKSSRALDNFKNGYSTICSVKLCQSFTILTVQKCFLVFTLNSQYLKLCPFPFVLSLGATSNSLAPSFPLLSTGYPCLTWSRNPRPRWRIPVCLSSAEQRGRFTIFDLLAALLVLHPRMHIGLLCCRGALLAHGQFVVHWDHQSPHHGGSKLHGHDSSKPLLEVWGNRPGVCFYAVWTFIHCRTKEHTLFFPGQ